ncbi:hypothetical protein BC937DRAFT_89498 [Endogone sp. FLAS-F59071]|nr:hypothetical protein BC937DRAFT_89498 [Endogone sp. FLAS-F59071]|eukprot:RUS17785.1 hypothetical protein BC937DRAFT_89498 [Endogone sp. FLAS-F59071]
MAHRIYESIGDNAQYLTLAYLADTDGKTPLPEAAVTRKYWYNTFSNICHSYSSALVKLRLCSESIQWLEKCADQATDLKKKIRLYKLIHQTALTITLPKPGNLGSTSRYPWDQYNFRKTYPTAMLNHIQQTIRQNPCLTVNKTDTYSSTNKLQFGVFTTGRIDCGQTLFMETDMLCVNSNISPVCENCNATLLDDIYLCARCQITFCNETCYTAAQYHHILCAKDISALTRKIHSAASTKTLIPLLIFKLFAIAITTHKHPLDLPHVHNLANIEYETNIYRAYSMQSIDDYLAIIGILGFSQFQPNFDYWVFLTLDNILTSNTFAYKASDGTPWKSYVLLHIDILNHSCHPNAVLSVEGSIAKVTALQALPTGDEVVISYIDNTADVEDRQKFLLNGWEFVCRCADIARYLRISDIEALRQTNKQICGCVSGEYERCLNKATDRIANDNDSSLQKLAKCIADDDDDGLLILRQDATFDQMITKHLCSIYDNIQEHASNIVSQALLSRYRAIQNLRGRTMLHFVAESNIDMVSTLIRHGVPIDTTDNHMHSPLWIAVIFCQTDVVALLAKHGAKVNTNVLHFAVSNDAHRIVEILLENGADPNATSHNGDIPLHWATATDNPAIIRTLVR